MSTMSRSRPAETNKEQAHLLIDQPPDGNTWDEVAYRIGVRASTERGLQDANEDRVQTTQELLHKGKK